MESIIFKQPDELPFLLLGYAETKYNDEDPEKILESSSNPIKGNFARKKRKFGEELKDKRGMKLDHCGPVSLDHLRAALSFIILSIWMD